MRGVPQWRRTGPRQREEQEGGGKRGGLQGSEHRATEKEGAARVLNRSRRRKQKGLVWLVSLASLPVGPPANLPFPEACSRGPRLRLAETTQNTVSKSLSFQPGAATQRVSLA